MQMRKYRLACGHSGVTDYPIRVGTKITCDIHGKRTKVVSVTAIAAKPEPARKKSMMDLDFRLPKLDFKY